MSGSQGLSFPVILALSFSLAFGTESPLNKEKSLELGKNYLAEGKAKEAGEVFQDLLKRYPGDPDIHLFSALAALRLRDAPAAEIQIRKALSLDPDHVEARTLLGWIDLEVRRDYAAAADEYSKVVRLEPAWAEAHNNLGVALKKKGDLEKALDHFNRAVELRADYSQAWSNRGWVLAEQKKWREARESFERALKVDAGDEGALYGLSQAQREARDYAGAEKTLRLLVARAPNFVYWLEWIRVELIRFYWLLLLVAAAVYLHGRYRKVRRISDGGTDWKKA